MLSFFDLSAELFHKVEKLFRTGGKTILMLRKFFVGWLVKQVRNIHQQHNEYMSANNYLNDVIKNIRSGILVRKEIPEPK